MVSQVHLLGAFSTSISDAFENCRTMQTVVSHIAWESEVWIAEDSDHKIHFNGKSFLGPYPDVMSKMDRSRTK